MAKISTLPIKDKIGASDKFVITDKTDGKSKAIEAKGIGGFVFRKIFYESDLDFSQVDPGDLTVFTAVNSIIQNKPDMAVYYWDSQMTTEKIAKFKLVEDFEVTKTPELGHVDIKIEGGITLELVGGSGHTVIVNLTLLVQSGGQGPFVEIKNTQSFTYRDSLIGVEHPLNVLNMGLEIDDLNNLPFEKGDKLRFLVSIAAYQNLSDFRLRLNPIEPIGEAYEMLLNISHVEFFQQRS